MCLNHIYLFSFVQCKLLLLHAVPSAKQCVIINVNHVSDRIMDPVLYLGQVQFKTSLFSGGSELLKCVTYAFHDTRRLLLSSTSNLSYLLMTAVSPVPWLSSP